MILLTPSLMRPASVALWRACWGFSPLPMPPPPVVEDELAISPAVKAMVRA